jgi:hypothetical protein
MVRDPLVWLGEDDPWKSTDMAREEDPELSDIREFFDSGVMDIDHHYKTQRLIDLAADDETKALLIRVSDSSGLSLDFSNSISLWRRMKPATAVSSGNRGKFDVRLPAMRVPVGARRRSERRNGTWFSRT